MLPASITTLPSTIADLEFEMCAPGLSNVFDLDSTLNKTSCKARVTAAEQKDDNIASSVPGNRRSPK